jgi:hypothetical protein
MKALLMAVIFLCSGQVIAGEECSQSLGMEAENAVDTMKSWSSIYSGFKRYKSCDDGGVAEGFTDAVVHLLTSDWSSLKDAEQLSARSSSFRSFLLRHIDASADTEDLKAIVNFSKSKCPANLKSFCTSIHRAAERAVTESAQ